MVSPASATAIEAPAARRAMAAFWYRFWNRLGGAHRDIAASLSISAAAHLALLLFVGAALFDSGEHDRDLPELSVQLVTREGPSSEEYTEAALPKPAPDPVEEVLDDPGTGQQTLDAAALADDVPLLEQVPDIEELAPSSAALQASAAPGAVLTTTGASEETVGLPDLTEVQVETVPKPEQTMLARNVQALAQKLLDTDMTNAELTWQQDGRQYSARVMRQPAADSTGLEQVIAEIMTDRDGKRMKTRLSLKRLAFSHFTQLVNFWDPDIRLHDDVIDGRFHSNTSISLHFSKEIEPRFFGKVTTAAARMTLDEWGQRRSSGDVFQGGVETRTERVRLPREMPDVVNGGDDGDRQVFDDDTRIIFNPDGSYVWRNANGDGPLARVEPSDKPRYLIGAPGARLYVRGTVSGIFTVYSPSDIEIEGDLVYLKDPRKTVLSRDFLALISGRDIMVARPQVTGSGDLHIHAALYARRRFCIAAADRAKAGRLMILGSLTAGTILETEPRFATKLDFDKRFEYLRPASFPMTRRYEVQSWDQGWEEVSEEDGGTDRGAQPGLARSE